MAAFRKKSASVPRAEAPPQPRVELSLDQLVNRVKEAAPALEGWEADASLVHARLSDHYRDLGLAPPDASAFEQSSAGLDLEGWRRLALAVAMLDDTALHDALTKLVASAPVALPMASGLLGLAQETAPLTVALVRQNATRSEEFARHLANRLGLGIAGETEQESGARLYEIYYKRLLLEAEKARAAAQEKMEKLRQKQSESDGRRRRGKW